MANAIGAPESDVPPKLDKDAPTGRLNLVASEPLLRRFDRWRTKQYPFPNKSEAARILLEKGLDAEEALEAAKKSGSE